MIVVDPYTGTLTNIINPKWKCPFCGAKFTLVDGSRALMIDDRLTNEDTGEVMIFL